MVDDYGNETGEYDLYYAPPVRKAANISAAKGETETRQFGEKLDYDKVILCDLKTGIDINEYSRLWIDKEPELDGNGLLAVDKNGEVITPHDYVVKKIAKSLNNISIAVRKVEVSEQQDNQG